MTSTLSQTLMSVCCRYGFHKTRCSAALKENDCDLGLSLESLMSNCFNVPLHHDDGNDGPKDDQGQTVEEILEQRSEEKMALESIYGDRFIERIPNHVWLVSLELPHLTELIGSTHRTKTMQQGMRELQSKQSAKSHLPVCRFFQKGFCRFGKRCKNRHEQPNTGPRERFVPVYDDVGAATEKLPYLLHVRFPTGNRYPCEVPLVAFSSSNDKMASHICLNISFRLMQEAQQQVVDCQPAIFSLISVLEDVDELRDIVTTPALLFSHPEPVTHAPQKTNPNPVPDEQVDSGRTGNGVEKEDGVSTPGENLKERRGDSENVQPEQRRKYGGRRSADSSMIEKTNRRLVEQFRRVQVCGVVLLHHQMFLHNVLHSDGIWPNREKDNIQLPSFSNILYTYAHTRLQNIITYIVETNKSKTRTFSCNYS